MSAGSAKDFDIVFLFGVPWDAPRQRPHHLATHLAAAHRVLYVEQSTRHRSDLLRPPIRRIAARITCVRTPFMVQPFGRPGTKRLENRLLARAVRLLLRLLDLRNVVVVHCDFYSGSLIGALGEVLDVYDCADDHAAFPWAKPATRSLEDDLSRKADLVFAVSEKLAADRRGTARTVAVVPNAAEVERFGPATAGFEPPADVRSLRPPILGYVGAIFDWLDLDLLCRLARAHTDWQIVLIGPVRVALGPLEGLANVHVMGPRPYDLLPSYLRAFDTALVPFKVNALTRGADLIKVYEYLATGIPVVGTDLPSLRRFGGYVRIGADFESFEAAVVESLADRSPEATRRRAQAVLGQDWSSRARQVDLLISEALALGPHAG